MSDIAITGMGAVSPVGRGVDALWRAIEAGRDGIGPVRRFPLEGFSVDLAALIPDLPPEDDIHYATREALPLIRAVLEEALGQAGLSPDSSRMALIMGSSVCDRGSTRGGPGLHALTGAVGDAMGIRGPRLTISTACASSANAILLGAGLLELGMADVVLAGGVCILRQHNFAGFHALGVLSPAPCAPFSTPPGTTLGEGVGFLVLERGTQALARGARSRGWLLGAASSADGVHPTSPDPRGAGLARALRNAFANAGLMPDEVGYLNAHGTGTTANDASEWRAIRTVFGAHADRLPVSSSKGMLGHAQDAAGALEAMVTLLSMERQVVPPTLHFVEPRAEGPADPVGQPHPRPARYRKAVSTSAAFGGLNAVLVLGLDPGSKASPPRRPIRIVGVGAVGPHGHSLDALEAALHGDAPRWGRTADFALEEIVPTADSRDLTPAACFLTAAAARALEDGQVRIRGALRETVGLMVGTSRVSAACSDQFWTSIDRDGPARVSARAFSQIVLNAAGGACSRLLSLLGPHATMTIGEGSGLLAIVFAAMHLATREDATMMVAGGLDEVDPSLLGPARSEGAGCVLLAAAPEPDAAPERAGGSSRRIRVHGWGIAGPDDLPGAVSAALVGGEDRLPLSAVDAVFGADPIDALGDALSGQARPPRRVDPGLMIGRAEASTSAIAVVAAVQMLRRGDVDVALVTAGSGRSARVALTLTAGDG